ncbi:hypothetical protein N431DRAFT_545974 [Stipitochalara longipes BDJ]|nr:hypothetical protein N431DRAFT_545974 [Stipitochalara longipes BDJ]
MSSGSAKDLTRSISSHAAKLTVPLPDELQRVINAYLDKHPNPDEADSQRLQDELLSVYQSCIRDVPSRLAPFLAILLPLKPNISGSGRLLSWWDKLSVPVLNNIGAEKGLAIIAKDLLLSILVYEEDEDDAKTQEAKATSNTLAETLLATWLAQSKAALEQFDDHAKFVVEQIQLILMAFGKRRPKDFLTTIDQFFVKKESRILSLSLLCEFIRHQPPHLHQLLSTPLFDNLLKCLQIDTSTRVISLAMTALIMFLPHIPSTTSQHLPALFNIYTRMLFWDRQRKLAEPQPRDEDDEKSEKDLVQSGRDRSWDKLPYLLESEDEQVPELLHYFTFLYGLYPINFMSYIRKPQRYLRHANFPGADDLDVEPTEIRQRSEPFRRLHLLHENFFHRTIESELTDNNRWQKSEAADVVAECMALYVPGEDSQGLVHRSKVPPKKVIVDSDIPEQPLLDEESVTPYQSRHTSWRNTTSTAVASPTEIRHSSLHRKYSQTSQSMPSIADSPCIHPSDRHDSPTIPPTMMASPSHNQLSDILNTQKSIRGSLYQALTNESVASLALSNTPHDSAHVAAYLDSLGPQRSPSLRPTTNDPNLKVAYLQREIQLLRNDLNFERYLKQQHLSHIGQIRRRQIREARVEADTQNLINENRGLKSKIEEARRKNLQMKKESEKSKAHSRKWEADLSAKLRVLREEQKKWLLERADLKKDLEISINKAEKLKQLVVTAESRELAAKQKTMSVEASLDELERLRDEVENLTLRIRKYEARDLDVLRKEDAAAEAFRRVSLLEMELRARDQQLARSKQAFEDELRDREEKAKEEKEEAYVQKTTLSQEMLDSVLESSRNKIAELKRQHERLLRRYTNLQGAYTDLKERLEQKEYNNPDEPLLGGGGWTGSGMEGRMSPSPPSPRESRMQEPRTPQGQRYRRKAHKTSDPEAYEPPSTSPPNIPLPARPIRVDTSSTSGGISPVEGSSRSPVTPAESISRSGTGGMGGLASLGAGYGGHFHAPQPFNPNPSPSIGSGSVDEEGNVKKKIVPGSEVRVFGRGGPQNIGKLPKEKKDKGKEKEATSAQSPAADPKKEKKSVGLRGIRGFV